MKKKNKKENNIISAFTRIVVYFLFVSSIVLGFCFMPKQIITRDQVYTSCAALGDIENSAVLLDYQVFGSKKRFLEALETKPLEKLSELKNEGKILMVKVYGGEYKEIFENDYWYVEDPNTIELNIEYYIVGNIVFNNSSIPCHTVYELANELLMEINEIFLIIASIISFGICIPFVVSISKNVYYFVILYKKKQQLVD